MSFLRKHTWEAAHATIVLGVITTFAVAVHLTGTPLPQVRPESLKGPMAFPSRSPESGHKRARLTQSSSVSKAVRPPSSDPREVVVGPSGINNRYSLLRTERKSLSPTVDELTVRLHVASLATEPLVSPFESDMLELRSPGLEPINPFTSFHDPLPAGETRDKNVVFHVPSGLSLAKATLHIHYFNYQKEIPLSPVSRAQAD